VDAISQWTPDMPPVFFINEEIPGDRLRFTLAHELGHVIMHQVLTLDPRDMEREADRFAAEFLMPAKEITNDFSSVTLADLVRMKAYWKVSMAALAKRAHDLGKLTPRQYRALFEQMSKLGYRTKEPEPIPVEEPMLANEILDVYRDEKQYSIPELSRLVVLHPHEFRAVYGVGPHKFRVVESKGKRKGKLSHSNAG
jgi:Zn-dependent peptidase ImmA (M78 family)